ncbi:MAG: hypothetical protein R6U94_05140, partial [Nitriliruptoraceae bacterium]
MPSRWVTSPVEGGHLTEPPRRTAGAAASGGTDDGDHRRLGLTDDVPGRRSDRRGFGEFLRPGAGSPAVGPGYERVEDSGGAHQRDQ